MYRRGRRTGRPVWFSRALLGTALAAAVAAVALSGPVDLRGPRSVTLEDGAAWLVSSAVGQATLVDGSTAQVVTRVQLGAGQLAAAQAGADAFVAAGDGSVRRVDGSTFAVSAPSSFAAAGQPLAVFPTSGALFAVNRSTGLVTVADPRSLAARATFSLSFPVADRGALTDGAARLWLIDARTGNLVRVDGAGKKVQAQAVDPGRTTLVTAGGRPVAVDLSAGRVRPIGAGGVTGGGACVDSPPDDDTVTAAGASLTPQVYLSSGRRGLLLISDLATGDCDGAVDLAAAGHQLGEPREAAGRVFVPDFTDGMIIVVDVAERRVVARANVLPPDTRFELRQQGALMFFNDPASSRAGVIRLDGSVSEVEKYDPANPGSSVLRGDADQAVLPGEPGDAQRPAAQDDPGGQDAPGTPGTRPTDPSQPADVPARIDLVEPTAGPTSPGEDERPPGSGQPSPPDGQTDAPAPPGTEPPALVVPPRTDATGQDTVQLPRAPD